MQCLKWTFFSEDPQDYQLGSFGDPFLIFGDPEFNREKSQQPNI